MDLEYWKDFWLFVIVVTQLFVVILPFTGKISDNRKTFWKRFSTRGYIMVGFAIVSVIATFSNSYCNNKLEDIKEEAFKSDLAERDSIHNNRIDSINNNLVGGFAKYGLMYNASEQRIANLVRDSSKIITGPRPDFGIFDVKEIQDSIGVHTLDIIYSSKQASSYNVNFKLFFVAVDEQYNLLPFLEDGKEHGTLAENTNVTKDQVIHSGIWISRLPKKKAIVFRIVGNYEDDRGQKIKLNRTYVYDFGLSGFGHPTPFLTKKVATYFRTR